MIDSQPSHQFEYQQALAKQYDARRSHEYKWQRENELVTTWLAELLPHDAVVLDVPIGTGRFMEEYLRHSCRVIGVDLSEDMLFEARTKLRRSRKQLANRRTVTKVDLVQADVTRLPLADKSVDVAVCIRLLNLVPISVVRDALKDLARVSQGSIIIGVRTHGRRGAFRRSVASIRSKIRGVNPKLSIHSDEDLREAVAAANLCIRSKEVVVHGIRGSSIYHIYVLEPKSIRL